MYYDRLGSYLFISFSVFAFLLCSICMDQFNQCLLCKETDWFYYSVAHFCNAIELFFDVVQLFKGLLQSRSPMLGDTYFLLCLSVVHACDIRPAWFLNDLAQIWHTNFLSMSTKSHYLPIEILNTCMLSYCCE